MTATTTTSTIYRTPTRTPDAAPIPTPSARRLLTPLVVTGVATAGALLATALFNIVAPDLLGAHADGETTSSTMLAPWVESFEDIVMWAAVVASPLLLGTLIFRWVRPSWRGFDLLQKVLYIGALIHALAVVVVPCETIVFMTRGGLRLFGPVHVDSATNPRDGRVAHVYQSCFFGCTTHVYVAQHAYSPTMKRASDFTTRMSKDPSLKKGTSAVWLDDGAIEIVYRDDRDRGK